MCELVDRPYIFEGSCILCRAVLAKTRLLDKCVAVMVPIVAQINTNLVTYPQMCDSEQLCRRFVKCREMLMALADLYV